MTDHHRCRPLPCVGLQAHDDVIQKLPRKARKGARVIFIPGNHDETGRRRCAPASLSRYCRKTFINWSDE